LLDDEDDDVDHKNNVKLLIQLTQKHYMNFLDQLTEKYSAVIREIIPFIAYIDFIKSNAKTSFKYNYTKPIINYDKTKGFVQSKQLRHPIVERLIDYGYIPHDLDIGDSLKGMLLYGLNSSGKSTIMKALGLSIIMAQSGLYVPAKEFIYSPYKALYTRINGNDNLFMNRSSFEVEMNELNSILKRTDKNSLVIGDEICRGTEHISGTAIVATSIMFLSKKKCSFLFATHLHELASMEKIKQLPI